MPSKDKYTVLLPTYNERDNIAIIVWLLIRTLDARYGHAFSGATAMCHAGCYTTVVVLQRDQL